MPTVSEIARITTRDGSASMWRACLGCGVLSAMAPEATRCESCTTPPTATAPAPADEGEPARGWSR